MNKAITLEQLVSVVAKVANYIKNVVAGQDKAIAAKLSDAPSDGKAYVRKNGTWAEQEKPEQQAIDFASDQEVNDLLNEAFK